MLCHFTPSPGRNWTNPAVYGEFVNYSDYSFSFLHSITKSSKRLTAVYFSGSHPGHQDPEKEPDASLRWHPEGRIFLTDKGGNLKGISIAF